MHMTYHKHEGKSWSKYHHRYGSQMEHVNNKQYLHQVCKYTYEYENQSSCVMQSMGHKMHGKSIGMSISCKVNMARWA